MECCVCSCSCVEGGGHTDPAVTADIPAVRSQETLPLRSHCPE